MLKISELQSKELSEASYLHRMRKYLYDSFPEARDVPVDDMETAITALTNRAAIYNLTQETDVAAFIVTAWLMGLDFDQKFTVVGNVLANFDLPSYEKTEFLWEFIEKSFATLKG
ncbi:hypothetical protein [Amphritea sp.]|uniref:hypothetical protein n=1 Tax=Amphritea sp. TaxID=1872502 RepID=UPI003D1077C0